MSSKKKSICLLNGSVHGILGNTHELLELAVSFLPDDVEVERIVLKDEVFNGSMEATLRASDAFIFGTGTYWDSWGSPLQRFLESATESEGTDVWLGKPAGVLVSMNSVGGKGVLSRLQGVLNQFGVLIPPMSGLVYSLVNQVALESGKEGGCNDFWRPQDVAVVTHNLLEATKGTSQWVSWPVDREDFESKWIAIK